MSVAEFSDAAVRSLNKWEIRGRKDGGQNRDLAEFEERIRVHASYEAPTMPFA